MDYTITITDDRLNAGIAKQLAAFNAGQADADKLTAPEFLLASCIQSQAVAWADQWAPVLVPSGKWLQRWTAEERKATRAMGVQNAQMQAWLDELDASEDVNLTHDVVRTGVQTVCAALESQGVIAAGQGSVRAAAILAY